MSYLLFLWWHSYIIVQIDPSRGLGFPLSLTGQVVYVHLTSQEGSNTKCVPIAYLIPNTEAGKGFTLIFIGVYLGVYLQHDTY